jgi:hypothetical protein
MYNRRPVPYSYWILFNSPPPPLHNNFFFFFLLTAFGPTYFKFMTKGITLSQNIFFETFTQKNRTPTPHIYKMDKGESCCAPTLFVAYIAELLLSLLDSNIYKIRNRYKKNCKNWRRCCCTLCCTAASKVIFF